MDYTESLTELNAKDIPGYEGLYSILETGEVLCLGQRKVWKKKVLTNRGYLSVDLFKDGKYTKHSIHRLIAITFIPNPDCLPEVNHKDGNKLNNSIDNLEWMSHSDNVKHAFRMGLKKPTRPNTSLNEAQVRAMREMWSNGAKYSYLAKLFNMSTGSIRQIVYRRRWGNV